MSDHHTGDHHEQHEHSDGHVVRGSYSLKEADGTTRIVEYVAGPHSGFNAVVKRIGHAHHPQHYEVHGDNHGIEHIGLAHGKAESYVSRSYGHGSSEEGGSHHYKIDHGKGQSYVSTNHWGEHGASEESEESGYENHLYEQDHGKAESYIGATHWGFN